MPQKRADAGSRTPDPSLTKRVLWPSELRRRDPRIVQRAGSLPPQRGARERPARRTRRLALEALADTRVVFVTGACQAGESTLTREIVVREHPATVASFDDDVPREAARSHPVGLLDGLLGPVAIDEVQRVPARSAPSARFGLGRNEHVGGPVRSEHVGPPSRCGRASLRRIAVSPLYETAPRPETRMDTGETERRAVTRNEGVRGSSPRVGFTKSPQTEHFQGSNGLGGRQGFPQRFPQGASRGRRGGSGRVQKGSPSTG